MEEKQISNNLAQQSHIRLRNNIPQKIEILAGLKIYAEYQLDIEKMKGEKMPIFFNVKLLSEKQ